MTKQDPPDLDALDDQEQLDDALVILDDAGDRIAAPLDGPWYRPDEPEPWASRFQSYLLTGPTRSILRTYNEVGRDMARHRTAAQTLPGGWRQHTDAWSWRLRAKLFDEHMRSQQRTLFDVEYREQLQKHRDRAQRLAEVSFNNVVKLMEIVAKRLATLKPEELANVYALLTAMRVAGALGETALNAEAHTLALDDIVAELESGQTKQHADTELSTEEQTEDPA